MDTGDADEVGDYALTRYYDPSDDHGLGETWMSVEAELDERSTHALLGQPFGPPGREFDPGKMGSYFQTPAMVAVSMDILRFVPRRELDEYRRLLDMAHRIGRGLYVTF